MKTWYLLGVEHPFPIAWRVAEGRGQRLLAIPAEPRGMCKLTPHSAVPIGRCPQSLWGVDVYVYIQAIGPEFSGGGRLGAGICGRLTL